MIKVGLLRFFGISKVIYWLGNTDNLQPFGKGKDKGDWEARKRKVQIKEIE